MKKIKISSKPNEDSDASLRKNFTAWGIFVDVYNEFAAETSIHGLKYTTQRRLKIDGFIWLTIVVISIVSAGLLASQFYARHRAAGMRTTVVSTQFPAWELKLPAVTLCHGTMARMEKLNLFLDSRDTLLPRGLSRLDLEEALGHLRETIEPTNRFPVRVNLIHKLINANSMTVHQFLEKVGPNCTEYLIMCKRGDQEEPCETLMLPSLTPYGLCCSFNYHLASGNDPQETERGKDDEIIYHSVTYGSRFALSFLMNPFLEDRISSTFYGDGIKVLIHESRTYPGSAAWEFIAPSGHETIANILGNRLVSSNEVLNLGENERSCINTANLVPPYRANNCYATCRDEAIKKACRCLPFFAYSSDLGKIRQCDFTKTACLARNFMSSNSLKLEDPECGCSPECEQTTYSVATTTIPLNAAQFAVAPIYNETKQFPQATALHITLSSQVMTLQRRDVVQSWINLLSSLGGVFSLFLGCSFISLIEIIYFFCICLPIKLTMRFVKKCNPVSNSNE